MEIAKALQCCPMETSPTAEVVRPGARYRCFHDGVEPSSTGRIRPSCRLKTPLPDLGKAVIERTSAKGLPQVQENVAIATLANPREEEWKPLEKSPFSKTRVLEHRLFICTCLGQDPSVLCHVPRDKFSPPHRACTR